MIARNMKPYEYYAYGDANNYGQQVLIKDDTGEPIVQGTVRMSINITSQSVQDNVNYKDCSYIGLTLDKNINDAFVIKYGEQKLKVQYVNPMGRYIQVFLKEI